ncbi:hypothetical protein H5410_002885, partial [Solanum commersonii]
GDFIVILGGEKKIGGLPVFPQEFEDFAFGINSCDLVTEEYIFKRLYRVVVNQRFSELYVDTGLRHLARTGYDGAPLLLTCGSSSHTICKEKFGYIFNQLAIKEDIVRLKEEFFEECPSPENRAVLHQIQVEQKLNTRFYLCLAKGRRKKLTINMMNASSPVGDIEIVEEVVCFLKDQFTRGATYSELSLLQYIQPQIRQD